jgi:hypothetical protein
MQSSIHSGRSHFRQPNPPPSIIAGRKREYRSAAYLAVCYVVAGVMIAYAFVTLSYDGLFLELWELLLRLHLGLNEWVCLVSLGGATAVFEAIRFHEIFDGFSCMKGFRHLYSTCRYLDPIQLMQCRLSYVIAAHPERFSYAFSGSAIVVTTRRNRALDLPVSVGSGDVEADDFWFLDTIDDGEPFSSSDVSEVVGSSELLSIPEELFSSSDAPEVAGSSEPLSVPEEQDLVQFSDGVIDRNDEPALPEVKISEISFQEQDGSISGDNELPVDVPQVHITAEAIRAQFRIDVSLREIVRLFLTENPADTAKKPSSEKRVVIPMRNMAYQALITYLARDGEKWMDAEVVMNRVYEYVENKEKAQSLFNTHVSRIRKQVREGIKTGFPEWASGAKDFDLFEQRMDGRNRSFWRLAKNCVIDEMDALNTFYNSMRALARSRKKRANGDAIEEKKLLKSAKRLIKQYSGNYLANYPEDEEGYIGGYLIENLQELPFRSWALSFFKECRQKYIFCLEQVAELEHLLWQEVKQPEYCNNATKLYKECAYAATCIPLDPVLGEHALRAGLTLYQESGELGEAESFYETYRRRMFKAQAYWSPEEETRALLAELLLVEEEE